MEHLSQSPTDAGFVQDPYPFYEGARACGDLFYWDDYGMICATSHAAVNHFLRDRNWGRELIGPSPYSELAAPFIAFEKHSLLEIDPPRHTALRGQILRAFTSRKIAEFGPQVRDLSSDLIAGFGPEVDLLEAFCSKIPVTIIARLLGVPEDMNDQLLQWSHQMVAMYQSTRNADTERVASQATVEFSEFIGRYIDKRARDPRDDLISTLIAAHEGDAMTRQELISTCILILNAGHEATVHALANTIRILLMRGDGVALTAPDRIAPMVEEALRYDPPLHIFERFAKADCEAYGHTFKRGDKIALILAAANRDPKVFDHPDQFVPDRSPNPQTSFGAGVHFCVGAPLARLEMMESLPVLIQTCPDIALSRDTTFANTYHFHGLQSLWVTTGR